MFAAIFNLRAEPIDTQQFPVATLGRAGRVAFLCSNEATPRVPGEECAIHSLGGRYWIVGRVRLDARQALRTRLADVDASAEAIPDTLLCLHAYARWGERFVDFLAGDFSFVLWDDERQELIAVRDRLGVRSLFHARTADKWFISDSLDWLAAHPSISPALDDYWIADFLTVGICREFERTIYRDIHRLPPAHLVKLGDSGASIRRYWRLDIAEPLYLSDRRAYPERFRDLLSRAIADRMPAGKVGIGMSGGLDSTTLAAATLGVTADTSRVAAVCNHYEKLMDIREDHFASLAARHLGIDLQIRALDDLSYDPHWRSRDIRFAEPVASMLNAHNLRLLEADMASLAPVWFDGEGPDNALTLERNAFLGWLWQRRSWGRLAGALAGYARVKGIAGWAQTFRRHARVPSNTGEPDALPPWLDRDLADRLGLEERAESLGDGGDRSHPWHPDAIASFTSPIWPCDFDIINFTQARASLVWRFPFLDLRVLEFMLSVPPVPWGWKKQLVREAMQGRLPPEVLRREKTPLPVHPGMAAIRKSGLPDLPPGDRLDGYVDVRRLPTIEASDGDLHFSMGAYVLDHWLASARDAASRPQ